MSIFKKLRSKKFLVISITLFLLIFSISFYRATFTSITYDEAYTYMAYAKNFNSSSFEALIKPISLANNHFLNTILIFISSTIIGEPYSEIAIRLPNLLFYIIYFCFSYKLSSKYKHKYIAMSLLMFNYGVHEFFGLARGYGMAASLVLMGIYYYKVWVDDIDKIKKLSLSFACFILACFANTVCLLVLASFLVDAFFRLLSAKKIMEYIKRQWLFVIFGLIIIPFIIKYHLMISQDGMPLFSGNESFFKSVVLSSFHVFGVASNYQVLIFITSLILLVIIIYFTRKIEWKGNLSVILIIYFVMLITSTVIFKKGWLTERLLIPVTPLYVLFMMELLNRIQSKKIGIVLDIFVILICIFNFSINLDFQHTRDWYDNYQIKKIAYDAYSNNNTNEDNKKIDQFYDKNVVINFYRDKILYEKGYDIFNYRKNN